MILPPTDENIEFAATALREGRLVGMPTETVYGLAANALDETAVRATFAAKGRPADNPLIVHVTDADEAEALTASFPSTARKLATEFWPGPLTLVLRKSNIVPSVTTGGIDTVAIRVPAHPVARRLIEAANTPVSAPSANPFMAVSPTRAADIDAGLAIKLACILDGGPCEVGLESTVVDVTEAAPRLLRPGRISAKQLESTLGIGVLAPRDQVKRSPGMYPRHYAPQTRLLLVDQLGMGRIGIALRRDGAVHNPNAIVLPADPAGFGAGLYAALHDLDRLHLDAILVECPPRTPEWAAIWDRLLRAAQSG